MKYFGFIILVACFPFFAVAQESVVEISCASLKADYEPVGDVEHSPGIDGNGQAVIPADLGSSLVLHREFVDIPVSGSFIEIPDIKILEDVPLEGDVEVVGVRIYPDGRVFYNGQDLTQAVKDKCGESPVGVSDSDELTEMIQQDGQQQSDAVHSAPNTDLDNQHKN